MCVSLARRYRQESTIRVRLDDGAESCATTDRGLLDSGRSRVANRQNSGHPVLNASTNVDPVFPVLVQSVDGSVDVVAKSRRAHLAVTTVISSGNGVVHARFRDDQKRSAEVALNRPRTG